ncbi:MAG: T9SS type A sorting domain-containing protein [Bacteroidia bacterium]|nr:T9SS type A sorting domain-containing protein [Bacteroidia bacterium]
MKQTLIFICLFLLWTSASQGQIVIAQWSFPTGTAADSIADAGIVANINKTIYTEGGTSAIDFSKNGFTTKAAQATEWNDGADLKCWVVEITTTDYDHLTISSKQQSGGNNPGPRDWKVQYRIGAGGNWTDVPNSAIEVQNDWSMGVLDSIELPEECKNQASVFLRWVMTTNTNSTGNPVEASGINKIDDIIISGTLINTAIPESDNSIRLSIYPNPCTSQVTISSSELITSLIVTDAAGRVVSNKTPQSKEISFEVGNIPVGCYFIRVLTSSSQVKTIRFFRVD